MATKDVKFAHRSYPHYREAPYTVTLTAVFDCCGTEISHACRGNTPPGRMGEEKLEHWMDNRVKRHRCELVSEENPMGLLPPNDMRAKAEVV